MERDALHGLQLCDAEVLGSRCSRALYDARHEQRQVIRLVTATKLRHQMNRRFQSLGSGAMVTLVQGGDQPFLAEVVPPLVSGLGNPIRKQRKQVAGA